jgi:acetyltransferase (GNAT) family protein
LFQDTGNYKTRSINRLDFVSQYQPARAGEVCRWVSTRKCLKRISSDNAEALTPSIIEDWVLKSLGTFVLSSREELIAFATISTSEWLLPQGLCEICHLVVAPEHRRRYHGSFFVNWLARAAVNAGHQAVVGRVLPENLGAVRLMHYLRWRDVTTSTKWAGGPYLWFQGPGGNWP